LLSLFLNGPEETAMVLKMRRLRCLRRAIRGGAVNSINAKLLIAAGFGTAAAPRPSHTGESDDFLSAPSVPGDIDRWMNE
jgi:hypothetical protein